MIFPKQNKTKTKSLKTKTQITPWRIFTLQMLLLALLSLWYGLPRPISLLCSLWWTVWQRMTSLCCRQRFCCPLCKMRAQRNVSTRQAEMSDHWSVAKLLIPTLLLGCGWTLNPGDGKSIFSILKDYLSIQCRSAKVHAFNLMCRICSVHIFDVSSG